MQNTGWLPSNVSKRALEQKVTREVEIDIALPEGAKLVTGTAKTMLGQLAGRDQQAVAPIWGGDATSERAKVEWVIEAEAGTAVTITATHQRAGIIRKEIVLG